jgi:hypothetical protein
MLERIAALGLVSIFLVGCNLRSPSSVSAAPSQYRGAKWMAWNDAQRDAFVSSYVDGYKMGAHDACLATDRVLDLKKGSIPEHGKDEIVVPSGVCRVNAGDYSGCKPGAPEGQVCSAYTQVITAFYTKHPEYQNIPYEYLMQYLTDKEHKSADDLYSMAKAGMMRTSW